MSCEACFRKHIKEKKVENEKIPPLVEIIANNSALTLSAILGQPFEIIKNRIQARNIGIISYTTMRDIVEREGGIYAAYKGSSAGIVKQLLYIPTRLGMYTILSHQIESEPTFAKQAIIALSSEMCAAFVATPAEVVLIRMTADSTLPSWQRRNYRNVFNAFSRIYREEGVLTLWRGGVPTIGRTMVLNGAQLTCYSQIKEYLLQHYNLSGFSLHLSSAVVTEFFSSFASVPVDLVKTRLQLMKSIKGKPRLYNGPVDVLYKTIKNEGICALWKGIVPYYLQTVPYTIISFILVEQLHIAYHKYILDVNREDPCKNFGKYYDKEVEDIEENGKNKK